MLLPRPGGGDAADEASVKARAKASATAMSAVGRADMGFGTSWTEAHAAADWVPPDRCAVRVSGSRSALWLRGAPLARAALGPLTVPCFGLTLGASRRVDAPSKGETAR